MEAVGRIGSYISRSVYTVSGPFHPFGGAVDVIVVEQPDGTYKSSPWYVRFGKFQGVLKTREKVVSIIVNGVEADFHMYLSHKGEAYFLKEVDEVDLNALCSPTSFGDDADRITNRLPLKSLSCNFDSGYSENEKNAVTRTDSRRSQILGLVFGGKSRNDEVNESGVFRTESLEHAEIAADLLDLKWSTNLDSPKCKKDNDNNKNNNNSSRFSTAAISKDETGLISCSSYIVETENVTSEVRVCSAGVISDVSKPDSRIESSVEKLKEDQFTLVHEDIVSKSEGTMCNASESIATEYSQLVSIVSREDEINEQVLFEGPFCDSQLIISSNEEPRISDEEQLLFVNEPCDTEHCSGFSLDQSVINDYIDDVDPQRIKLRTVSSEPCITGFDVQSEDVTRIVRLSTGVGTLTNEPESINKHQSSEDGHTDSSTGTPSPPVNSLNGSQRSWPFPFQRSRSMKTSQVETNGVENPNTAEVLNNTSDLEGSKGVTEAKENKKTFIRTLTPTSEQLASLNLKEGKNTVVFTFQTSMLGNQQVDARIFMWRWDTRIVISDVDGTITRSDLLGQVMPLVGMDWSHTGVAHLFSAIKENGYQLIFLSARSIAQSFITRQFLFNIKQDGKALPDGPVVISPDGLFPSLFREVVRRAPHEFKIACLEDIKALFPANTSPFYAGFGNRDTDEFSYLKVGIPRGKIFIINPKGEIVVNRRVDTKSYSSLHDLVHGMFPSTVSTSEQEDFNSWNFWKIPPPVIDL